MLLCVCMCVCECVCVYMHTDACVYMGPFTITLSEDSGAVFQFFLHSVLKDRSQGLLLMVIKIDNEKG